VSTPEEDLRIAEIALASITPKVLQEVFRNSWDTEDINIYLFTDSINVTVAENAQDLANLFLASQEVPVDPPVEKERVVFAYTEFGSPGIVMEDSFVPDLGIRQMTLSNGVRLNMKQTDFEAGVIRFVGYSIWKWTVGLTPKCNLLE
jgi:zinc protease